MWVADDSISWTWLSYVHPDDCFPNNRLNKTSFNITDNNVNYSGSQGLPFTHCPTGGGGVSGGNDNGGGQESGEGLFLNSINFSDDRVCSNYQSNITIKTYSNNNTLFSVDGMLIETSLNITGEISQNIEQNTFYVFIENITEKGNKLEVNATAFYNNDSLSYQREYQIEECSQFSITVDKISDKLNDIFMKNWVIKLIVGLTTLIVLVSIIVFSKLNSSSKNI